jgi:putative ABC transport system permease protein
LLIIGFELRALFQSASHVLKALLLIAMIAAAAFGWFATAAAHRRDLALPDQWRGGQRVDDGNRGLCSCDPVEQRRLTTPRIIILIAGIILGTLMSAASVVLNSLLGSISSELNAIKAQLALGYTRWEAMSSVMRRAVHSRAIPIINQMAGAGIITLPGIM